MNPLMDPEKLAEWKANRLTKAFLQYLADRRTRLMEAWAAGANLSAEEQAASVLMGRLLNLQSDDLKDFYDTGE